jgi:hypothetical protein
MANPNIVGVTTIVGITTFLNLTTTDATVLLSNAASSNKVFKVNTIVVANDDGAAAADITIKLHDAAAGAGTSFALASTVAVTQDSTLIALDKASSIYLEENRSITVTASAANDLDVVCSYEEISS